MNNINLDLSDKTSILLPSIKSLDCPVDFNENLYRSFRLELITEIIFNKESSHNVFNVQSTTYSNDNFYIKLDQVESTEIDDSLIAKADHKLRLKWLKSIVSYFDQNSSYFDQNSKAEANIYFNPFNVRLINNEFVNLISTIPIWTDPKFDVCVSVLINNKCFIGQAEIIETYIQSYRLLRSMSQFKDPFIDSNNNIHNIVMWAKHKLDVDLQPVNTIAELMKQLDDSLINN